VTAGGGEIRANVQEAIRKELDYRLGEGDAAGALTRWQKELVLLVIHAVRANACLTQLHARAAIKAGATLAQVLDTILYIELTGMVKWVMVGYEAYTAAEAAAPEEQRTQTERDAWAGQEQRFEEIKAYLFRDGRSDVSEQWMKLARMAPGILDGYIRMRESFVRPDPHGSMPKKLMELIIIAADIAQAHPHGAVRHTARYVQVGGSVAELVEGVALVAIECGVQSYKQCGRDVIEAAEAKAAMSRERQ
jgi:alkylhydroperoxidase/carboxymuconolactone decarboxylase family protein YurZ